MTAQVLATSAAVLAALMVAVWLLSLRLRNASIVDIVWGSTFVLVAWTALLLGDGTDSRRVLLTVLTTVWGLRLSI